MNITELTYDKLKAITSVLQAKGVIGTFYMNHAPKSATTPYIVFRIEDILDNSPSYTATIKFMCYDDRNKTSSNNINNADVIMNAMNKVQFNYDNMAIHSTLILQQDIPSEYLTDKQCIEQQYNAVIYI